MNHQLLRLAPVAFAAALALTACNRQETPAPKTAAPAPAPAPAKAAGSDVVKIGHVGPISGAIAHLGKDNENGARLAVEEINAAGGLGGRKLEVVTRDTQSDPTKAVNAASELTRSEKVKGKRDEATCAAAAPPADQAADEGAAAEGE